MMTFDNDIMRLQVDRLVTLEEQLLYKPLFFHTEDWQADRLQAWLFVE